jgi:Fe-S cluster biogenesis protein NfuA
MEINETVLGMRGECDACTVMSTTTSNTTHKTAHHITVQQGGLTSHQYPFCMYAAAEA